MINFIEILTVFLVFVKLFHKFFLLVKITLLKSQIKILFLNHKFI